MNQALSYIASDEQIIAKMYLNFFMNIALRFSDCMLHSLIIVVGGLSFGYFPLIQVF